MILVDELRHFPGARAPFLVIPRKVGVPRAIALLTHEVSKLVKLVKP
jgi:hypothetical protein